MEDSTMKPDRLRVAELVNEVCTSLADESEDVARLVVQVLVSVYELDTDLRSGGRKDDARLGQFSNTIDDPKGVADSDMDTTLAEMMTDAMSLSNTERVLIVGYWFQICRGLTTFTGFQVNKELAQLGYRSSNITADMTRLMERKPQLMLQVQKSGKSKQGRKAYKLSSAGIEAAKPLIAGGTD